MEKVASAPKSVAEKVVKAAPAPKAKVEKAVVVKAAPAPQKASSNAADDLKKIEGIGPKIEELLHAASILTFKDLSVAKVDAVKAILVAGLKRSSVHNPASWTEQAQLAASGKWAELQKLQDELIGGKKK